MGYACPVCGDPQADARHLANHLAFTAMLRRGAHEEWLDDHAPGWAEAGESELADRVAGDAETVEFPQVFEDTAGGIHGNRDDDRHDHHGHHNHGDHRNHRDGPIHNPAKMRSGERFDENTSTRRAGRTPDPPTDDETERIIEEARELTRRMREGDGTDDGERTTGDGNENA